MKERMGYEFNRAFCDWHYPHVCRGVFSLGCDECPLQEAMSRKNAARDDKQIFLEQGISLADLVHEVGAGPWEALKYESSVLKNAIEALQDRHWVNGHYASGTDTPLYAPNHRTHTHVFKGLSKTSEYLLGLLFLLENTLGLEKKNFEEALQRLLEDVGSESASQVLQVFSFLREHFYAFGCLKKISGPYSDSSDAEKKRETVSQVLILMEEAIRGMQGSLQIWVDMDWLHQRVPVRLDRDPDAQMRATATTDSNAANFMFAATLGALSSLDLFFNVPEKQDNSCAVINLLERQQPHNPIEAAMHAQSFVCTVAVTCLYTLWPYGGLELSPEHKRVLNLARKVEQDQKKALEKFSNVYK